MMVFSMDILKGWLNPEKEVNMRGIFHSVGNAVRCFNIQGNAVAVASFYVWVA